MVKKKNTTRICGKCKKAFLVGRGHNARTCGKVSLYDSPASMISKYAPADLPNSESSKALHLSEMVPFTHVGVEKKVPVPQKLVTKTYTQVAFLHGSKNISLLSRATGKYENLPEEWLQKYNFLTFGKDKFWFNKKGQLHHRTGFAVEWSDGRKEWWVNGKLHRLDGPAKIWSEGSSEWWADDKLHRLDGPAAVYPNGNEEWWVNGKLHRLDGPAVEWGDGRKEWWADGKLHRLDGPAVEAVEGHKGWWVNGLDMEKCADHPSIPEMMGNYFYLLCTNTNPKIRQKALANPNCPPAWKVAGTLLQGKS